MSTKEMVDQYIQAIYDTYLAHVVEHKDYETFGHAMAIVLPTVLKILKDLSDEKEKTLEGAKIGDETEQ